MHSGIPPFLVVLVVLQAVSGNTISEAAAREETGGETERIIGGQDAAPGQFPYAAALHFNNSFICTSSILSPRTVMTAAHCVVLKGSLQPADLFSAIANVDRTASAVRIEFESVTPHPGYSEQTLDNDIAILKTREPIDFGAEVNTVCIAHPDNDKYQNVTAMGWGKTNRDPVFNNIPEKLQYVQQKIVSNTFCSFLTPGVNEDKLCAKGFFTGICNGDSGGPLVHLGTGEKPVEIGIASYMSRLAVCGTLSPAVFTRVSAFHDFIMQTAEDGEDICVARPT